MNNYDEIIEDANIVLIGNIFNRKNTFYNMISITCII